MVELSGREGDSWRMGFAGDTFNAAWYARAVLPEDRRIAYVTALGDDPFSRGMRQFIDDAGVISDRIRTIPGRKPGLYAITLEGAERSFTYWRGESAARSLADDVGWLNQALAEAELIYLSGITLAILDDAGRDRLMVVLGEQRAAGARIAFDPNYRPALWESEGQARRALERIYECCDVALPTFEDDQKLFGDKSPAETAERLARSGIGEIVVKNGAEPCLVANSDFRGEIAAVPPERLVDTTGAGDSFSGSYLAGRILGLAPERAAALAHRVAAQVIGTHGALTTIDRATVFAGLD
jgi:2-dehydro-3-deoxygluconokinase